MEPINPIEAIYKWQVDAGNADRPYDDFLESSFQIEEALEGLDDLGRLGDELGQNTASPKELSRAIVQMACIDSDRIELADVDRLDKACDAVVFAVGSMAKLGLTVDQLQRALHVVNNANQAKLGCPRDEHGKLTKPDNFPHPEPLLQQILDER